GPDLSLLAPLSQGGKGGSSLGSSLPTRLAVASRTGLHCCAEVVRMPRFVRIAAATSCLWVAAAPAVLRAQTAAPAAAAQPAPAAGAPAPAPQPEDPRTRYTGTYHYVGGAGERAALDAAIERAIADMSFITRPIARGR